jgi:hypothetical protein
MAPNATNSSGKPENGSRNGSQSVRPGLPFCNPRDARASWEFAYVRSGKRRTSLECCRVAAKFNRITDCSASLSRLRCATNFRSFVFSSRNCLASCAWLTSIPPYFAFQSPTASALRSSAPLCDCFSTYSLPPSFAQVILSFVRKERIRSNHPVLLPSISGESQSSYLRSAASG